MHFVPTAALLFSLMLQFILPVVVIVMHYVGGIPAAASFSDADGMMLAMMMMMMMTMIVMVMAMVMIMSAMMGLERGAPEVNTRHGHHCNGGEE